MREAIAQLRGEGLVDVRHSWAPRGSGKPRGGLDADIEFHARVTAAARGPIGVAAHRFASMTLRPLLQANAGDMAGDDRLAALHRTLADAVADGRPMRAVWAARAIAEIETQPPRPP